MTDDGDDAPAQPECCPGCGSWNVRKVVADEHVNFLCRECGCCWHRDGDRFRAVDPRACPGCLSRPVCIRRLWEPLRRSPAESHHDRHDGARQEQWC